VLSLWGAASEKLIGNDELLARSWGLWRGKSLQHREKVKTSLILQILIDKFKVVLK
jgi:hypothetical protein